jgi:Family of unknown function (DUF5691)
VDALTRVATTGTSREALPTRDLPTDDLLGSARRSPERDLLLRAGMRAVFRMSGKRTQAGAKSQGPAPVEKTPVCSSKAAENIRRLLTGGHDEILREVLERLRIAGLRLPHALLPVALDVQQEQLRPFIVVLLGERGLWLARQNPNWGWAVSTGESEGAYEAIWEEGALEDRLAALRHVRRRDADRGLGWVEEAWKSEKADVRISMVAALGTGLSPGDESFLENALDDRSVKVREAVASLLARIPGSAYAERATARADSVLASYEPPAGGLRGVAAGLSRRGRAGKLEVRPPEYLDEGWRRDLPASNKPPQGVGEKAWRITQALSVVPPGRWERRFGVTPDELVASARGDWEAALLTGWSRAAEQFGAGTWAFPIWERCQQPPDKRGTGTSREWDNAWDAALALVPSMSQTRFAAEFPRLLREGAMTDRLASTLSSLPAPWDEELGHLYLEELRKHVAETFARNREEGDLWLLTPRYAAGRIPPPCFEHASFDQPDEVLVERKFANGELVRYEPYHLRRWRKELAKFEETLELRSKLVEEIPL